MTAFLDTSAIVKLYVDEPGHVEVRAIEGPFVAAEIAIVEFASAVWRKSRLGELSAPRAALLVRAFREATRPNGPDRLRMSLIGTDSVVLARATAIVARHDLRAYDSVQLASALLAHEALDGCRFASFDHRLDAAAAAEGLASAFA
ncbi:MAG: type II toxin-antitoxin system VapC family toxin [Actinomycetota bacterium]